MVTPERRKRLDEIDALLRTDGDHLETVAKRWGVSREQISLDLLLLKKENGALKRSWHSDGNKRMRLCHYVDPLVSSLRTDPTSRAIAERKQAVAKQIRRHAVLRSILEAIADLRKDDDEGAGWVVEQIAKG